MEDLSKQIMSAVTLVMPRTINNEIKDKCLHSDLIHSINEIFSTYESVKIKRKNCEPNNSIDCKKVRFSSEAFANIHIAKLKSTSTRKKIPNRAYLCEHCNLWHLTSSDKKDLELVEKYRLEVKRLRNVVIERDGRIKNMEAKMSKLQDRTNELSVQLKNCRSRYGSF